VGQEPVLFSGSIAYNILYGQPNHYDENVDFSSLDDSLRDRIVDVAKAAHAHHFIAKLKDGLISSFELF
jgi:ABC-type multidrug transport system fused ATPase/permease subunit